MYVHSPTHFPLPKGEWPLPDQRALANSSTSDSKQAIQSQINLAEECLKGFETDYSPSTVFNI